MDTKNGMLKDLKDSHKTKLETLNGYEAAGPKLPDWYKNHFLQSEDTWEEFVAPEEVYFAMRSRSELIKLMNDKLVFCLYKPDRTMKHIKNEIDEII
jgi:hypothetical protein